MPRPVNFLILDDHAQSRWALRHSHGQPVDYRWGGRYNWIFQTAVHLEEAGVGLKLTSELPRDSVAVIYAQDAVDPTVRALHARGNVVVAVRADRSPVHGADLEIVQNKAFLTRRTRWIPLWPQADLVKREPRRPPQVTNIALVGRRENLHPFFESSFWEASCRRLRIHTWSCGAYGNDFSDIDLAIAVRRRIDTPHLHKPASKLINAWVTGVPAVLGREMAFREIGSPGFDYIEIARPEHVIAALKTLSSNPEQWLRLQRAGALKARMYTDAAILRRWMLVLREAQEQPARHAHSVRVVWRQARHTLRAYHLCRRYERMKTPNLLVDVRRETSTSRATPTARR